MGRRRREAGELVLSLALVERPNVTSNTTTHGHTLSAVLEALAEAGSRPALVKFEADGLHEVSHARLHEEACGLARGLADAGFEPGCTALICGAASPAWVAACLGVIAARGVASPIDAQMADDELGDVIEDSGATWAFVDAVRAERIERIGFEGRVVRLDLPEDEEQSWRRIGPKIADREKGSDASTRLPELDDEDRALLFYTSGTTGAPKGVPLEHRHVAHQLRTLADSDLLREDDRVLQPLPLHHVYPLVVGTLAPLAMGRTVVMPHAVTGPQILRAIREASVSIVIGVPRLLRALASGIEARLRGSSRVRGALASSVVRGLGALRRSTGLRAGSTILAPLHRRVGRSLRVLASGGSKLDPSVGATLEGLGWQVAIGYGLTETSPILTIAPPGRADLESVGRAIDDVELRVDRDARGADEDDEIGEILARGPSVFAGYHRRERETREAFTDDGFFRTGDLGRIDGEGRLHLFGRASTMIVTQGGENVPPERLESAYAEHPSIEEVGVLVTDDDELAALVVPSTDAASSPGDVRAAIDDALRARSDELPSHHRVSSFRITREALPRTRLGKLRRHRLAERFRDASAESEGSEPTRGQPIPIDDMTSEDRALLERSAAREAWRLLARRHSDVGLTPDADLRMDLGVDSLGWVDLSMQVHERTGVELDEERIASIESVRDLLRAVADAPRTDADERLDPLADPEGTLSADQRERLAPLSPGARRVAGGLYAANRALFARLFRLRVEGAERVPRRGPFVLAPNHVSYLDPFAIAAALPQEVLHRTLWAGWTGAAFRNRLFRGVSRLTRTLPLDPETAARSGLAFAGAVVDRCEGLVWFPEGQRSRDGTLQEFREGIGRLITERPDVPVVPAHVGGTHDAWPVDRRWPRRGRVRVRFGEPVTGRALAERSDDPRHAAEALRERVASLGRADGSRDDPGTRGDPMAPHATR